jgi:hypothetical protein
MPGEAVLAAAEKNIFAISVGLRSRTDSVMVKILGYEVSW